MKVACLQFAPELGKVDENIQRANTILSQTALPANLDWLVLPELAFTGYNFQSLSEIKPYLEPTTSGISTRWAISMATTHRCHVTVGYPEITTTTPPTQYNSTVTVSPTGQILANYRKSFLYYTDETWSSEGTYQPPTSPLSPPPSASLPNVNSPSNGKPFFSGPLGALGNVTLGICMDINPYRFTAPWDAYEFAFTALSSGSRLICVSMAWLCTLSPTELMADPHVADVATVAYWVERFQPIVAATAGQGLSSGSEEDIQGPVYVVLANRSGMEGGVCYAGSSTVLKIENGGVSLYDTAGKSEERCLVIDLDERPKFEVRSAGR